MLGTLLRLAMVGTGARITGAVDRAMFKLAVLLAAATAVGLLIAVAIATFAVAIYLGLAPDLGAAWSAAAAGLVLVAVAGLLALVCWAAMRRRRRRLLGAQSSPLGAAALGASMGALPDLDLRGVLSRNATTVLLSAFIAGMLLNNRR